MERLAMVERLVKKTNISYEKAKDALEKNNWDILDAMLYLEKNKIVKAPLVGVYVTNSDESYNTSKEREVVLNKKEESKDDKKTDIFVKFFEWICRVIDKGNNIFLQIKRGKRILLKLPLTVLILLLLFAFGIIIPLFILGLFINIEYEIIGNYINKDKINKFLSYLSESVNDLKEKNKKEHKND